MSGLPDQPQQPPAPRAPLSDAPAGPQPQPQQPPAVESIEELSPKRLEVQMRWALYQAAIGMAQATVPQEAAQWGEALLRGAQAVVILDPSLVAPQGVPPDALSPPRPRIQMDTGAPSARHAAGG